MKPEQLIVIYTPRCPLCDEPPGHVLDLGRQAFCTTLGCGVLFWDMTMPWAELMANVSVIDAPFSGES